MMKYLLINIHDVTPYYEKDIDMFLKELRKRNIRKFSLSVIPKLGGKFNLTEKYDGDKYIITKYPRFLRKLKKLEKDGAQLMLHGYDHIEGKYLNSRDFEPRTQKAIAIFRKAFGHIPEGYVPPLWLVNNRTKIILKKYFKYIETHHKLVFFNKKEIYGFPLGMESWSSNKLFRYDKISPFINRCYSIIYSQIQFSDVLRFSIHPREYRNGNFRHVLKLLDNLLEEGWVSVTYSELNKKI